MMVCKYCGTDMRGGASETIDGGGRTYYKYRFFYTCPKCKAVYEGIREERGREVKYYNRRWFNPNTKQFEGEQ